MSDAAAPSASTADAILVRRYGRTQRVAHWWIAISFFATCVDAPEEGAGLTPGLIVHIATASALVLGVLGVLFFGNRAALSSDVRSMMVFDATDREYLRSLTVARPKRQPVRWGKFNTGQKLAAWAFLALLIGVFATGVAATLGLDELHTAMLATTFLVIAGHVAMAVVNPKTRPAMRGMLTGLVDRAWARKHHGAWLDDVDRKA